MRLDKKADRLCISSADVGWNTGNQQISDHVQPTGAN